MKQALPKTYRLSWAGYDLELGHRTGIMGVVNVTPDSFSDGGKFLAPESAVTQGRKLAADGADILDIGGESTRPFSDPVPVEVEIERVIPVIEQLAAQISIPISIDTMKAEVARRAIKAGASIINDISALRFDPDLGAVAAEFGTPVVLMHMLGSPKTMQLSPSYTDLMGEISDFLGAAIARAQKQGISKSNIIIDPGIGFGKTVSHNLLLIRQLHAFTALDAPILVGPSRKAFIRKLLKDEHSDEIPPDTPIVETGTQAAVAAAVLCGAHIVRVHDVANTRATIRILDAMKAAEED
ncbi:MAG: dihydropteroate synthase [Deltaproteobacteria bacterium]|jgi:dihydropteroate synthase|nr:dihydropteroate synthase [Deltaproteobacteria bacterium]